MKNNSINNLLIALTSLFLLNFCSPSSNGNNNSIMIKLKSNIEIDDTTCLNTTKIISERLNSIGIKKYEISYKKEEYIFEISIKKAKLSCQEIARLISTSGKLEFRETFENSDNDFELQQLLMKADSVFQSNGEKKLVPDLIQKATNPGSVIGYTTLENSEEAIFFLTSKTTLNLFPERIYFVLSQNLINDMYEIHAIKLNNNYISGKHVISSNPEVDKHTGAYMIMLEFDQDGAIKWEEMTRQAAAPENHGENRCIAMLFNNRVISSPKVMSEITGGKSQISGNFNKEEAELVSKLIQSGSLPVQLEIVSCDQISK